MHRTRRLHSLWSWLPAFRAVAEAEHLPTASRALHVTPSALSRTLRLLEADLGQQLFVRSGGRIVLNPAGRTLLDSVRQAMRGIDDGLTAIAGGLLAGPVHIASSPIWLPIFVLPALLALRRDRPLLVPHIHRPRTIASATVLDGRIDLALTDNPVEHDQLELQPLSKLTYGVYCGDSHPLLSTTSPSLEQALEYPFVVPDADQRASGSDGFPSDRARRVGMRYAELQVAVDACMGGELLACLPDAVGQHRKLNRLDIALPASRTLYALRRREPSADAGRPGRSAASIVLDAISASSLHRT